MKKWRVVPKNDKAADEAALLFENVKIKTECQRLLGLLTEEDDPGKPESSELHVQHLEHHAPNWYRLRVDTYKIRIAFSLAYIDGDRITEYQYGEIRFDNAENYIRVEYIDYRSDETYIEIRRRWRKAHGR